MKVQTRCWPGSQSFEGLTEAGESVSKVEHTRDQQIGPGCRDALVPRHVVISTDLLCVLEAYQLASPRACGPREANTEATTSPATLSGNSQAVISSLNGYTRA